MERVLRVRRVTIMSISCFPFTYHHTHTHTHTHTNKSYHAIEIDCHIIIINIYVRPGWLLPIEIFFGSEIHVSHFNEKYEFNHAS